jgi:putative ABC transport system permease protein
VWSALRGVVRSLGRSPKLAAAIVSCIAVSVGGAVTVLTFLWGALWRPLPFPEADRLMLIVPPPAGPPARPYVSLPDFVDLRESLRSLERLEGAVVSRLVVEGPLGAERLRGETVTAGYFDLLGLTPQRGRLFTADEYAGRGERVLVASARYWRSRLGAREEAIGRPLATRAGVATLIGVLPDGFLGIAEDDGTDYWLPERQHNHRDMFEARGEPTTLAFGRLRAGVSRAAASEEVGSMLVALEARHPARSGATSYPRAGSRLEPLAEKWRQPLRSGLVTLFVGALLLLLIGCGNVALLLLVRLLSRLRELSVRLSLGASRGDLIRLQALESGVLAVAGGGLGILSSLALQRLFERVAGTALPSHLPIEFGWAPFALGVALVAMTGLLFGVLPAWVAARVDPATSLRSGGRGDLQGLASGRGRRGRIGRLLVIGQTAVAVVLLASAVLFLRSYERLRFVDFGFRTENLLRYQVSLDASAYPTPESLEIYFGGLADDLAGLPGARRVAYLGPTLPPYDAAQADVRLVGGELAAGDAALGVEQHYATNEAFSILGVPLLEGRWFGPEDRRGGAAVGLVSATLARRIVGPQAPLGAALGRSLVGSAGVGVPVRIVGVVADARWNGQRNRAPTGLNLFLSLAQFPRASLGVLIDAAVDPHALVEPVRRAALARDPSAALHWIDTMSEALDFQTVSERFWAVLAAAYATTALFLAVLGLYGLLAHGVSCRVREIGLRVALGASRRAVIRLVVAQGLRPVVVGLAVGLTAAYVAGRAIESRLYGIDARDPVAFGGVAVLLLAAALAVSLLPARRAARIEPVEALRGE